MVYNTPNLDYFVNSNRQWNHRENADSENDDCCHVAGIPLGIVAFILGIAFIVNRLYILGAIVTALSVIALTIACVRCASVSLTNKNLKLTTTRFRLKRSALSFYKIHIQS